MFLKEKSSGQMVEVMNLSDLFDLFHEEVVGRYQRGEEEGDPEKFKKADLIFLEAMKVLGVGKITSFILYKSVSWFGIFAWKSNKRQKKK